MAGENLWRYGDPLLEGAVGTRIALISSEIGLNRSANLARVLDGVDRAAEAGASLVLFPEAASGLTNNDHPPHDLLLGEPIPGPVTERIAAEAARLNVFVGLGLLEREGERGKGRLYDSAVLFDSKGRICLKYRRVSTGWHGRRADPDVYRQGSDIPHADTSLGRIAFLVCGDLFDEDVVRRVRLLEADLLLFPFARCFGSEVNAPEEWERVEKNAYAARAAAANTSTLMVNYVGTPEINDTSFGGALAVGPDGQILASLPVGSPGMLLVDLDLNVRHALPE